MNLPNYITFARILMDGAPSAKASRRRRLSGRTGLNVLSDPGVVRGAPSAKASRRRRLSGRTGLDVLSDPGVVGGAAVGPA